MASFTSSQSGLWSSASTWGGAGVPGNGDTVTIASGHTVTFDVDQSSFASGLAGLTVNGTLKFKEDVVTCLKMTSNVNIVLGNGGTLKIGDIDNPIQRPSVGSEWRARLILQGTGMIDCPSGTGTITMVGWTPDRNHTTLSNNANSGTNQIQLNESLNLQSGDKIVIGAKTINGRMTETNVGLYTVQSVSSDGKTVTLTQNLGHNRLSGDYVAWYNRPINLSLGGRMLQVNRNYNILFKSVYYNKSLNSWNNMNLNPISQPVASYMTGNCNADDYFITNSSKIWMKYENCTFYNEYTCGYNYTLVENSIYIQTPDLSYGGVRHGVFGKVKNCMFSNYNSPILNSWFYQTFMDKCIIENCTVQGKSGGFGNWYSNLVIKDCVVDGGNIPLGNIWYYNCIVNTSPSTIYIPINHTIHSFNHNQVSSAYRAWLRGGTIQSVTNIYPPCSNKSYQYTLTSNTHPVHRTLQLGILQPQQEIQISCWLYKTLGSMSIQPRFQLIDNNNDPLVDPSAQPLQESISNTSISNQWEELTIRYKNTTDKEIPISVRCLAANSTGFIYEYINLDRIFYMSNVFG